MSIFDTDRKINVLGLLRCQEMGYNYNFFTRGAIKFGTPQQWAERGKKEGDGRGDILEGTFATCHREDIEHLIEICKKYNIPNNNVLTETWNDRLYFKNKRSMNLPSFCLYGINYDLFEIEPKKGWQEIQGIIPGDYFRAFSDITSNEDIKKLGEKRPSVVWITDINKFKKRIIDKLLSLGIKENEIIITPILYYDYDLFGKDGWIDFAQKEPNEIAIKHKKFSTQSEVRIIVNSRNEKILDYIRNNIIEIGSIEDISQIMDAYFDDGILIKTKINICTTV